MSRRQAKQFVPEIVKDVADLIDFFLDHHSVGLLVLLGDVRFPDSREFSEMICCSQKLDFGDPGVRVQGGESVPEAQRVIERVDRIMRTIDNVGGPSRASGTGPGISLGAITSTRTLCVGTATTSFSDWRMRSRFPMNCFLFGGGASRRVG